MKIIISESRLDMLMQYYFETEFENSVLEVRDNLGEDWLGLWLENGVLLVGVPAEGDDNTWFFNGKYFDDQWKVFGIDSAEFSAYMTDFLNKKYKGEIKINKIY